MADTFQGNVQGRIFILPRSILAFLGLLLLGWVLYQVKQIIILALLAAIFATALYPPVRWLKQRHIPRGISILLFYVALLSALGGIIFLLVNTLTEQVQHLIDNAPIYTERILDYLETLPFVGFEQQVFLEQVSSSVDMAIGAASEVLLSTIDYIRSFVGAIIAGITVLVMMFYLLNDPHYFKRVILDLIPESRQEKVSNLLDAAAQKTGAYVRGQLLLMLTVGIVSWLAMRFIGVPYAAVIGLIAFLLEIIPLIGPIIATVIAVLLALAHSPTSAIWVLIFFIVMQQLENYILAPRILGHSVRLHPFWILASILIGGTLLGFAGVLLSVPVAVVTRLVIQHFYVEEVLHRNPRKEQAA